MTSREPGYCSAADMPTAKRLVKEVRRYGRASATPAWRSGRPERSVGDIVVAGGRQGEFAPNEL
jgi:hypothetical protein